MHVCPRRQLAGPCEMSVLCKTHEKCFTAGTSLPSSGFSSASVFFLRGFCVFKGWQTFHVFAPVSVKSAPQYLCFYLWVRKQTRRLLHSWWKSSMSLTNLIFTEKKLFFFSNFVLLSQRSHNFSSVCASFISITSSLFILSSFYPSLFLNSPHPYTPHLLSQ